MIVGNKYINTANSGAVDRLVLRITCTFIGIDFAIIDAFCGGAAVDTDSRDFMTSYNEH